MTRLRAYRFVIANVFAEQHFGGNPLAVFPEAEGLSTAAMQSIARQLNLAETTFVLPPRAPEHAAQVRIFTPAAELPFAGHPTVGTAAVLARLKRGAGAMVLEEAVGPVPVTVDFDGDKTTARFVLDRPIERPHQRIDLAAIAPVLSVAEADLVEAWFASAGVPLCFVQLVDRAAVDRAVLDHGAWTATLAEAWTPNVYIFTGYPRSERIYARMFAPALGVPEDPATGAAAAALVGLLAEKLMDEEGVLSITIDQGVAMGRPSVIAASAVIRNRRAISLSVGGETIIVAEGSMRVPIEPQ